MSRELYQISDYTKYFKRFSEKEVGLTWKNFGRVNEKYKIQSPFFQYYLFNLILNAYFHKDLRNAKKQWHGRL